MELNVERKCACAECGHEIAYLESQAGTIVECPSCHEKSQLPEKLGLLQAKGPPLPQFRVCDFCGAQINFLDPSCSTCEARDKRRRILTPVAAIAFIGALAIAGVLTYKKSKPSPVVTPNPTPHMYLAQPVAKAPKSTSDLQASHFVLERTRGDTLATAVGDILNNSDNVHHQIRAEVDLLDKNGAKVGTVSDSFVDLGANQTWHFVANVTDTNAMSIRFAGIKEDL